MIRVNLTIASEDDGAYLVDLPGFEPEERKRGKAYSAILQLPPDGRLLAFTVPFSWSLVAVSLENSFNHVITVALLRRPSLEQFAREGP